MLITNDIKLQNKTETNLLGVTFDKLSTWKSRVKNLGMKCTARSVNAMLQNKTDIKFMELTFDRRLTWKSYADDLADKSKCHEVHLPYELGR